jgi:hypothetical protein
MNVSNVAGIEVDKVNILAAKSHEWRTNEMQAKENPSIKHLMIFFTERCLFPINAPFRVMK